MKTFPAFQTPAQLAARFGCTEAQAARLLARNLDQTQAMATKAERTGRKVGGSEASELRVHAERIRSVLS